MHATKLGNKRLLISFEKQKDLKMCIAKSLWAKNVFTPNEQMLSAPALKGTGMLKNSINKVIIW